MDNMNTLIDWLSSLYNGLFAVVASNIFTAVSVWILIIGFVVSFIRRPKQ